MNLKRLIRYCYLLLFFITPLIFTSFNSELFELPKMYFVYTITIIISTLHLINTIYNHQPLITKNRLTIPLLLFLISITISTIISVDTHTSIFGYYSRLNGGLLSTICYIILFLILNTHINISFRQKIINTFLASGLIISLYAIGQHLGIDKNLWVQDVQSRVFSTLGQPNWLAALLCILLPFSLYQYLQSKKTISRVYFIFVTISLYSSLLFSKSKSGIIAGLISLTTFATLSIIKSKNTKTQLQSLALPGLILILLTLTISSPIKNLIFPTKINQNPAISISPADSNITPSQNIRKIVWTGALDLWQQFPFFGTGTETFAYSYYWTRPVAHNLTSEWEFLYNKAHNEYLNFLATTGTLGLLTYSIFLLVAVIKILSPPVSKNYPKSFRFTIFASFLSILITNFAGFSVVITNLYLFLLPALAITTPIKPTKNIETPTKKHLLFSLPILAISIFLLSVTLRFYLADISYANSQNNREDPLVSLDHLQNSLRLRPNHPIYLSQAAINAAQVAINSTDQDQSRLVNLAISYSTQATDISPANTNLWKERAQTYYYLSTIDNIYFIDAIDSLTKVIALAPTDAKTYYLLGRFLQTGNLTDQAISYYQQSIDLKPNYDHSHFALGQIYFQQKKYPEAQSHFQSAITINPKNIDAQKYLDQIQKTITK